MTHRLSLASSMPFGLVWRLRLRNQVVIAHHLGFVYWEDGAAKENYDVPADALGKLGLKFVVVVPIAVPAVAGVLDRRRLPVPCSRLTERVTVRKGAMRFLVGLLADSSDILVILLAQVLVEVVEDLRNRSRERDMR